MTPLQDLIETTVESGTVPGAAALVARMGFPTSTLLPLAWY